MVCHGAIIGDTRLAVAVDPWDCHGDSLIMEADGFLNDLLSQLLCRGNEGAFVLHTDGLQIPEILDQAVYAAFAV